MTFKNLCETKAGVFRLGLYYNVVTMSIICSQDTFFQEGNGDTLSIGNPAKFKICSKFALNLTGSRR